MKKIAAGLGLFCLMLLLPGCPGAQLETVTSATTSNSVTEDPSQKTYSWSIGQWSACSATTCGTNGTQTRSVICKRNDGVTVKDSFCTSPKPLTSRTCSAAACPVPPKPTSTYSWSVGSWSTCSAKTCGTNGTQTRSVTCKKDDGTTVSDSFCTSAKPATSQACAAAACPVPTGDINVRDYGAVGNGKVNDIVAFQNAIKAVKAGGTVRVPAGTYLVDVSEKTKIALKSNMTLAMDPNAIIKVKPNALERHYVFNISSATNVELYGGQIIGDRDDHLGTTGEWGFGIRVGVGASKVRIHDIKISNMWGDGICLGGYPDDIVIQRVIATNNRRQGLSITTATNVQVLDSEFSYTNGTKPEYGIDIEPDGAVKYGNYARNILIQNCKFQHNKAGGVQVYVNGENVTIKNNVFSNNMYGIYSVKATGGEITGNTFEHNIFQGVSLNGSTTNYKVYNNFFNNNSTKAVGMRDPNSNPIVSITGMTTANKSNIIKSTNSTAIDVGANKYQK